MSVRFLKLKAIIKGITIFGFFKFLKNFCLSFQNTDESIPEHELGITAIIKNEAPYMKEWIEFHRMLGVSKFYIYDNESTDNIKEILKPYIEEGLVKYKFIKGKGVQKDAYNNSIYENKNEVKWMAFIDIDEFITPVHHNSIVEYLAFAEEKYGKFDAIGINWLLHGFNGNYNKKEGLIIENYKKCDFGAERNNHIKTILKPKSVIMTYHPHFFIHKSGSKMINTKGIEMYGPFNEPYYEDIIIHHYFTKSYEEHKERYKKGKADLSKTWLFDYEPDKLSCDNENSMERFIEPLKKILIK